MRSLVLCGPVESVHDGPLVHTTAAHAWWVQQPASCVFKFCAPKHGTFWQATEATALCVTAMPPCAQTHNVPSARRSAPGQQHPQLQPPRRGQQRARAPEPPPHPHSLPVPSCTHTRQPACLCDSNEPCPKARTSMGHTHPCQPVLCTPLSRPDSPCCMVQCGGPACCTAASRRTVCGRMTAHARNCSRVTWRPLTREGHQHSPCDMADVHVPPADVLKKADTLATQHDELCTVPPRS